MSITDVAIASGFNSVRRFNDAFQKLLSLTPSQLRNNASSQVKKANQLLIKAQCRLDWDYMLAFLRLRLADHVESIENREYKRTFQIGHAQGWFAIQPAPNNQFLLRFSINDLSKVHLLVKEVKRMFELESNLKATSDALQRSPINKIVREGIAIPGVLSTWEAGVRAILGQQVSVKAAISQLNIFVESLGRRIVTVDEEGGERTRLFPSPNDVINASLDFLKMPNARRETLKHLAQHIIDHPQNAPDDWIAIKGIGPWTVSYAKLRGMSDPNQFLSRDLVIKKAMKSLSIDDGYDFSPWGSYATLQLWNASS